MLGRAVCLCVLTALLAGCGNDTKKLSSECTRDPARITREVVQAIREASLLAPLHNDNALQGIEAGLWLLPSVPAGAVFDTAFHRTLPDVAAHYSIPHDLAEQHALRRYGFHGISHRYVSERLLGCLGRSASAASF